eukprot:CAMPEP_0119551828 /NCGR_PEP_ID=MMETSP1352-20130426/4965_1 /TAXON_ID=265584 /ORGANISM="Stauroneis constricta, Strain CCMP1120" /LENGTH=229 /DNA_ID=CAMNT_0007597945 /DNA_START=90 /DNA_END=779 /DNA_ORIENTATION=-
MSPRIITLAALATFGMASAATIGHLRIKDDELDPVAVEDGVKAIEDLSHDSDSAKRPHEHNIPGDDDDDCDDDDFCPSEGTFKVEKGVSCGGGFKKGKGIGKECKAGVKGSFHAKMDGDTIAASLVDELHPEISSSWILTKDAMMESWNPTELEAVEWTEGMEKTVEFGGFAKVEWGCKVSFKMKDGKFTKTGECGAGGKAGMGKKPDDDDTPTTTTTTTTMDASSDEE